MKKHKCSIVITIQVKITAPKITLSLFIWIWKVAKCNMCDFDTNTEVNLKRHTYNIHSNVEKHKSSMCDYVTNKANNLNTHTVAENGSSSKNVIFR